MSVSTGARNTSGVLVRPERAVDVAAIHAVNARAFPTADEARLVDALRNGGHLVISLVAESEATHAIVGHVAFSPVTIDDVPGGLGLAPIAVDPSHQRRGVGERLVRAGLVRARELGAGYVVILGDPAYGARFGFRRASERGLSNEYGVDEPFQVLELRDGALPERGGLVRYGAEFASWS